MTSKQKCEKLAAILETVAEKMRDPSVGAEVWAKEEPALQTLVAQLSIILRRATEISSESPSQKSKKQKKQQKDVIDEWPDIITE